MLYTNAIEGVYGNRAVRALKSYRRFEKKVERKLRCVVEDELAFLIQASATPGASSEALHYIAKRAVFLAQVLHDSLPDGFHEVTLRQARIAYVREKLKEYEKHPWLIPNAERRVNLIDRLTHDYIRKFDITWEEVGLTEADVRKLEQLGVISYLKVHNLEAINYLLEQQRPLRPELLEETKGCMAQYSLTPGDLGLKYDPRISQLFK